MSGRSLVVASLVGVLLVAAAGAAAAQGPDPVAELSCRVPDVRGKTLAQIQYHRLLSGLASSAGRGCRVGDVTTRAGDRAAPGRPLIVGSQRPRAGTVVAYFTPVALKLARAPASRPGACRLSPGSELITRTSSVLVYRTFKALDSDYSPSVATTWRACVRSTGMRRAIYTGIDDGESRSRATNFTVAGSHVAYTTDNFESKYTMGDVYRSIAIFDIAAGRRTFDDLIGMTRGGANSGGQRAPDVLAVVVNERGFAAWLTHDATGTSLYPHDSRVEALLDHTATGEITDVRLRGNLLSWTLDGAAKTAALKS